MSYHLEMERGGKVPKVEMPAAIEPQVAQETQAQYDVHPDIAKEFKQQNDDQSFNQDSQEIIEPEEAPAPVQESKNERNIKILREKAINADKWRQERDFLEARVKELEKPQAAPEQDNYNLGLDEPVEARHLQKYDKKIQDLQNKIDAYEQQNSLVTTEALLKSKYPDIDNIVSVENLAILRMDYPDLADSINSISNFKNRAVTAYTLIKKLGIAVEDTFVEDKIKAQKNAAKPKSVATLSPQQGESPLTQANAFQNGLTDELKMQLRKEMEAARRAL